MGFFVFFSSKLDHIAVQISEVSTVGSALCCLPRAMLTCIMRADVFLSGLLLLERKGKKGYCQFFLGNCSLPLRMWTEIWVHFHSEMSFTLLVNYCFY